MKRRRLDSGLRQKDAAKQLGVRVDTFRLWEGNATLALPQHWPGLIKFLGGYPFRIGRSFPEKFHAARLIRGLTHREIAEVFGVDPSNVSRWERGIQKPANRIARQVRDWLQDVLQKTPQNSG